MTAFQQPITINGNVFFASDFHLGAPNREESDRRERKIISWLNQIQDRCTHLFLLGDIFDYWFEYKDVVPRGYYLLFAKLHEMHEKGIVIYYFTGNHDMWVQDYFSTEFGAIVFKQQQAFVINGKRCLVGHGDGLGPKDHGYKFIKAVFAFRPNRTLMPTIVQVVYSSFQEPVINLNLIFLMESTIIRIPCPFSWEKMDRNIRE